MFIENWSATLFFWISVPSEIPYLHSIEKAFVRTPAVPLCTASPCTTDSIYQALIAKAGLLQHDAAEQTYVHSLIDSASYFYQQKDFQKNTTIIIQSLRF